MALSCDTDGGRDLVLYVTYSQNSRDLIPNGVYVTHIRGLADRV